MMRERIVRKYSAGVDGICGERDEDVKGQVEKWACWSENEKLEKMRDEFRWRRVVVGDCLAHHHERDKVVHHCDIAGINKKLREDDAKDVLDAVDTWHIRAQMGEDGLDDDEDMVYRLGGSQAKMLEKR